MIRVQVNSRTVVFVNAVPDTCPNKGGYFCEVFRDEEMDFPLESMNFSISNKLMRGASNRYATLVKLVTEKVKCRYGK